jgi:hypothetical protein
VVSKPPGIAAAVPDRETERRPDHDRTLVRTSHDSD